MKIGILTWHKVVNHGAVLQAYALQSYLLGLGHDVVVLNYDRVIPASSHLSFRIKRIPQKINRIISGKGCMIKSFLKEKDLLFSLFRDNYIHQGNYYNDELGLDAVFIGSDQVFDLLSGYHPYMFGKGVKCKKIFSYAPCAAQTTISIFSKSNHKDEIVRNIHLFKGLSARDSNTQNLLQYIRPDLNIPITIDPVLLYGFEKEKKEWKCNNFLLGKKYIVIYAYHTYMDDKDEIAQIVKYAKLNDCITVALGYRHAWCDLSVNANPQDFLSIIDTAHKVVTDTFHGTVFSIICNTEFCTIIRESNAGNSNKLGYLLSQFQLEARAAKTTNNIFDVLCCDMDWTKTNQLLEKFRAESKYYIKNCLAYDK